MEFQDKIDQFLLSQGQANLISCECSTRFCISRTTYYVPHTAYSYGQGKIQGKSLYMGMQPVSLHLTYRVPRNTYHAVPTDKRRSKAAKARLSYHVSMSSDFQCPTPTSSHAVPLHRILQSIYRITRQGNRRKRQECKRKASRRRRI